MVNLELYKVFYTVAKCGSLTKAAEELYITQPAVSQAIKQLETQLGMPLFNRTRKGVELSVQGGALVYGDVEHALQILLGVEDKLSQLKDSATGSLRIGASESIFHYCLAKNVVRYHELYPQVRIEIQSSATAATIENLKADRCDVGFLNLPIEEDKSILLTDTLMMLSDVFIGGEAFEALKKKKLSLWDLQHYPLILMQEHSLTRAQLEHFCHGFGVKLEPAIEVDSWGCMKRLVADGMGIGCLPREYAKERLADGSLFELDVSPALPARSVGMAIPKTSGMSYALRAFINLIRKKS